MRLVVDARPRCEEVVQPCLLDELLPLTADPGEQRPVDPTIVPSTSEET